MAIYRALMRVAKLVGLPKRSVEGEGYEILLTGSFYAENWLMSHLRPLAMSTRCARLRVVSTFPVPPMDKIEAIYPAAWLVRWVGAVPARLLTFLWVGLRTRPHIVGGFHLLVNGLVAGLLGRLVGSRSMYFCVGGPAELLNGGIGAENRLFGKLETPDPVVEQYLTQSVAAFDLVITMGNSAIRFFRERGVETTCHIVPGGVDSRRFHPSHTSPTLDLIFIGRLVAIKRVELFLHTIKGVARTLPGVTATVVGDGPLRGALEEMARELGVERNVTFVGHQRNVEAWLQQSKVFVLTSESEGLSLSLMEAMLCGLPAVVTRVGDLENLVANDVNGYLVSEPTPEVFAARILDLLRNPDRLARFARAARQSALRYELRLVTRLWDDILKSLESSAGSHPNSALRSSIVQRTAMQTRDPSAGR